MRIAFFVTYFPKMSEVFLLNQALALLDRGHSVIFYALADPGERLRQPGADRLLDGRAHVGLEAFGRIAAAIPEARYEIFGDGPEGERLKANTRARFDLAAITDRLEKIYCRATEYAG